MAKDNRWLGSDVKLPEGRIYQLPTGLDKLFVGIEDIGLGPRYLEHVRKDEMHLDLGGPRNEYISYIYTEVVEDPNEIFDGRLELIGPDINELPEGLSLPFAMEIKVCGPGLTDEHVEYLERVGVHPGIGSEDGVMLVNARSTVWARVRAASLVTWIPPQSPLAGVAREEVKVIGEPVLPWDIKDPETRSSLRDPSLPIP